METDSLRKGPVKRKTMMIFWGVKVRHTLNKRVSVEFITFRNSVMIGDRLRKTQTKDTENIQFEKGAKQADIEVSLFAKLMRDVKLAKAGTNN